MGFQHVSRRLPAWRRHPDRGSRTWRAGFSTRRWSAQADAGHRPRPRQPADLPVNARRSSLPAAETGLNMRPRLEAEMTTSVSTTCSTRSSSRCRCPRTLESEGWRSTSPCEGHTGRARWAARPLESRSAVAGQKVNSAPAQQLCICSRPHAPVGGTRRAIQADAGTHESLRGNPIIGDGGHGRLSE
jgi:hypothetical protein